ncbi:MAG: IPTL-CTERM sorting domain-containing protein [Nitrospirae bacterium]|nr:IPTL-CTERM sorting domain-containing protein [Nitrospirota bacterium]
MDFAICSETDHQLFPSVAYNSSANQYLVVWYDLRSGANFDIYGQLVNANGSTSGGNFLIRNNAVSPHVIANAFCPNYLVAFWVGGNNPYTWTLVGDPCQQEAIPTMNEWGMIISVALAGIGSLYYLRRRHSV